MPPLRPGSTAVTIGVDIGGTAIKAAVVDAAGAVLAVTRTPTPPTADATDDAVLAVVDRLRQQHDVAAVGLAVAGFLSADRATVMFAPHLAWRDSAVPDRLTARLGIPVAMDHDVNSAAWAEYRIGAAQGVDVALLVALGTGIGAGLVVDGRIYRGAFGVAPELGHLTVVPDGRSCSCGKRGCWERYCSGTALAATAFELSGVRRSGAEVGSAARSGDAAALAAVADLAQWLAAGLALAIDVFDPRIIVLGGGVSVIADLFLPPALAQLPELVTGAAHRPLPGIVAAASHDTASMVGAGLLAHDLLGR